MVLHSLVSIALASLQSDNPNQLSPCSMMRAAHGVPESVGLLRVLFCQVSLFVGVCSFAFLLGSTRFLLECVPIEKGVN